MDAYDVVLVIIFLLDNYYYFKIAFLWKDVASLSVEFAYFAIKWVQERWLYKMP